MYDSVIRVGIVLPYIFQMTGLLYWQGDSPPPGCFLGYEWMPFQQLDLHLVPGIICAPHST